MSEQYTVGVVGAGQISAEAHLPVLRALPQAQVLWVADRQAERAALVGRGHGIAGIPMPERAEDLPPADVVLLAIPYGARPPLYPALAARGAAIYVEKPFAMTPAEHDAIVAPFGPSRVACGLQRRAAGGAVLLRRLLRAGAFGPLRRAVVEFGVPGARSGSYQHDARLAGAGLLFDVGVHALDLALHATDARSLQLRERHAMPGRHAELELNAAFDVESAAGPFRLELLVSALRFTAQQNRFEFDGATLVHDLWGSGGLRLEDDDGTACELSPAGAPYPASGHELLAAFWRSVFDALDTGRPNESSAVTSRLTTEALALAYSWL